MDPLHFFHVDYLTTTPLVCEIWPGCDVVANSSPSWQSAHHRSSSTPLSLCSVKELLKSASIFAQVDIFLSAFVSFGA